MTTATTRKESHDDRPRMHTMSAGSWDFLGALQAGLVLAAAPALVRQVATASCASMLVVV